MALVMGVMSSVVPSPRAPNHLTLTSGSHIRITASSAAWLYPVAAMVRVVEDMPVTFLISHSAVHGSITAHTVFRISPSGTSSTTMVVAPDEAALVRAVYVPPAPKPTYVLIFDASTG